MNFWLPVSKPAQLMPILVDQGLEVTEQCGSVLYLVDDHGGRVAGKEEVGVLLRQSRFAGQIQRDIGVGREQIS